MERQGQPKPDRRGAPQGLDGRRAPGSGLEHLGGAVAGSLGTVDGNDFEQPANDLVGLDPLGLGVEVRQDAVPQHREGGGAHVLDAGMEPSVQHGPRLRAQDQVLARPGAGAPLDVLPHQRRDVALAHSRRARQAQRVADDVIGHGHAAHDPLELENPGPIECRRYFRLELSRGAADDLEFLLLLGIIDEGVEHEAVELGLGQRVGSLLLDRILRGQHEERFGQPAALASGRHLVLLHRLEQRGLGARRGAVDLVGQHQVGEDRAGLEAEGIAAAGGKPQWSVGALQYMLRNEKYCGDALLQKTFVENCISKKTRKNNGELPKYLVQNHHEAIIDRTLFEKVQAEIARRAGKRKVSDKTSKTGQSKYSGRYALTELLICGNCGTPYKRVTWSKRGKKKIVWRCISRLDYGTKYCKSSPTVDEERLQAAVLKAINAMMSNRERLIGILKTNLKITLSEKSSGATNPYAIENRIRELQDSMMELVAVAAKAGNAESYEDKFREISEEIKSLQKTLEQYQAEQNGPDKLARQMDDICKALEDAPFEITEYSNNIVRQFIDTIKVVNEDKLLFIFKGGITMEQPLTI